METLWKVNNLVKSYRIRSGGAVENITALDGVSLEISRGETFGLIGESGSGKTTLGKTIIRLVEPDSGEIYFRDTELTGLGGRQLLRQRRNFQIVFQDPYKALNPRITAGGAVAEGVAGTKAEKRERTKELFSMVGISPDRIDDFPHQFSGGEKQRVSIARALSTSPAFIVCDEPTSSLDLSIQAKILNLFIELKERMDLTYLFISHNLKVVEFIADRVAVMYGGRIVESGSTASVARNPLHPYTRILLAASFMKKTEAAAGGKAPDKTGCLFAAACPHRTEICIQEPPVLSSVGEGRMVACHRETIK